MPYDDMMYEQHLQQAGLTRDQAAVYEALITKGALPASKIGREAKISRTLTYFVLDQLAKMGLVEKHGTASVATFTAMHPIKMKEVIEKQRETAEKALTVLETALPGLESAYRLASGKPGIEFFEGEAGVARVLNDTLTSKEEIYTYADLESIEKYVHDINQAYMQRRIARGVSKKIIVPDMPATRAKLKNYHKPYTEIRLAAAPGAVPFQSAMEMYENKIAYITFEHGVLTASVIHDAALCTMHRFLFQALWEKSIPVESLGGAQG